MSPCGRKHNNVLGKYGPLAVRTAQNTSGIKESYMKHKYAADQKFQNYISNVLYYKCI